MLACSDKYDDENWNYDMDHSMDNMKRLTVPLKIIFIKLFLCLFVLFSYSFIQTYVE